MFIKFCLKTELEVGVSQNAFWIHDLCLFTSQTTGEQWVYIKALIALGAKHKFMIFFDDLKTFFSAQLITLMKMMLTRNITCSFIFMRDRHWIFGAFYCRCNQIFYCSRQQIFYCRYHLIS